MLRRKLRIEPEALGVVRFSWLVESLMAQADLGDRDTDDCAVRIVLAFDGDRSQFSPRNAMLSELALMLTGEPMPYATLMYSWCQTRASGQTIINARTDRIRTLVVEAGNQGLGHWKDYVRDVRADYLASVWRGTRRADGHRRDDRCRQHPQPSGGLVRPDPAAATLAALISGLAYRSSWSAAPVHGAPWRAARHGVL